MTELEKKGIIEFTDSIIGTEIRFKGYCKIAEIEYYSEPSEIKKVTIHQIYDLSTYFNNPSCEYKKRVFENSLIPKEIINKIIKDSQYSYVNGRYQPKI